MGSQIGRPRKRIVVDLSLPLVRLREEIARECVHEILGTALRRETAHPERESLSDLFRRAADLIDGGSDRADVPALS